MVQKSESPSSSSLSESPFVKVRKTFKKRSMKEVEAAEIVLDDEYSCEKEKIKKTVSFHSTVYVVLIPTIAEYEAVGIKGHLWYGNDEYSIFKTETRQEIAAYIEKQQFTKQLTKSDVRMIMNSYYLQLVASEGKEKEKEEAIPAVALKEDGEVQAMIQENEEVEDKSASETVELMEMDEKEEQARDDAIMLTLAKDNHCEGESDVITVVRSTETCFPSREQLLSISVSSSSSLLSTTASSPCSFQFSSSPNEPGYLSMLSSSAAKLAAVGGIYFLLNHR
jgi:hypothetical protein